MNTDRLRSDLADLAEEAAPVDLRDRTLRTSRRLGIQRAVTTSAAALVLLGAATGTAFALNSRAANGPAPASTATATVDPDASPSVTAVPTSTPNASPTTAPGGTETGTTATIGRIFYGGGTAPLTSWSPGSQPHRLANLSSIPAMLNAAVSPDGRKIAWVDDKYSLYVAAIDGSARRKLLDQVDDLCWTPAWSADSRTLTVGKVAASGEPQGVGLVDVATGAFTQPAGLAALRACHPVWSGDGSRIAAASGDGQIFMMKPDGGARKPIPGLGGSSNWVSLDLASLSPDGSRIALLRRSRNQNAGDVARELNVNVVLDTRTGAEITLPLGGRELNQVAFQSDGTLVARVKSGGGYVLVLIGADGKKISETHEPTALASLQILAITG